MFGESGANFQRGTMSNGNQQMESQAQDSAAMQSSSHQSPDTNSGEGAASALAQMIRMRESQIRPAETESSGSA